MSASARVIAFAFRRKGAARMARGDMSLLLSYDLRWFAPADAKRFVARALENGLLVEAEGELAPAFDLAAVEVPVNFRPDLSVLDEEVDPNALPRAPAPVAPPAPAQGSGSAPVPGPAPVPAPAPGADADPAIEAERMRRGLLLSAEVARLLVERRAGADVAARAAELEARLLRAHQGSMAGPAPS